MANGKLDALVQAALTEILEAELEEVSTSAAAGPYMTPNAFSKSKTNSRYIKNMKKPKKVKETSDMNENRYHQLKSDQSATSVQKIGRALQGINSQLHEIDRELRMHSRLKKESGVESSQMWRRSLAHLTKMEHQMLQMANKIRELKA